MEQAYHDSIFWVEADRIRPNPFQPRREFDPHKLQELAESIRQYGLLQPITVSRKEIPKDDGGWAVEYELIAGERRLRAAKLAGLPQIPAIIRTAEDTDQMKLELAIIENLQREDLNPIDRALAFKRLVKEFGFKHADVGKKIGRSREYVSNSLRLLALPEHVQQFIADGKIGEGHSRPILMLVDKPEEQEVLVKEIMLKKLTVRESEAIARRTAQDRARNRNYLNPELLEIEKDLTERLGTRVQIEQKEVGGRLVISYFSRDDLSQILSAMQVIRAAQTAADYLQSEEAARQASDEQDCGTEASETGGDLYADQRPPIPEESTEKNTDKPAGEMEQSTEAAIGRSEPAPESTDKDEDTREPADAHTGEPAKRDSSGMLSSEALRSEIARGEGEGVAEEPVSPPGEAAADVDAASPEHRQRSAEDPEQRAKKQVQQAAPDEPTSAESDEQRTHEDEKPKKPAQTDDSELYSIRNFTV